VPGSSPADRRDRRRLLWDVLNASKPLRAAAAVGLPLVVLNRLAGLAPAATMGMLVDDVLRHRRDLLWRYVVLTIGAAVVQGVASMTMVRVVQRAQEQFVADLRRRVQSHLLSLPLCFHDTSKTGTLVSTVINDVQSFARVFGTGVMDLGGALAGAIIAFTILTWIEPSLAAVGLGTILFYTFLSQSTVRKAKHLYDAAAEAKADAMGRLNESLAGVRVVKAYAAEPHENAVFASGADRMRDAQVTASFTSARLRAFSSIVIGAGMTAISAIGALKVISGAMTIGDLMTFTATLFLLIGPIGQLASIAPQLSEALTGAERTLRLLARPSESAGEWRPTSMPRIVGRVVFEDVSFAYREGLPVLHHISFAMEPGSVTALVSRSGGGKSTIAALMASLYTPASGHITVDGHDLRSVTLDSYRRQLGLVLQETFLFDGTILDNVAFARRGVSRAEIMHACAVTRVDDFVRRLPDQYDTVVGERGVMLSGGERQRIAIARALLVDPRLLILDEPTFGLDAHAEELVYDALRHLMRGRTTLIIAHRLARVRQADQILVLENGTIVERGTHAELIGTSRVYRALVQRSDAVGVGVSRAMSSVSDAEVEATPSA